MAKILQRYCESAIGTFKSQVEATELVGHNATAGAIREQLLRDFLAAHLPQLITIASGLIFDSTDRQSKQQDVVLVLKSMPRLPFASGQDLIYCEGVVATIEIKTTLNGAALRGACENIGSVKALKPSISIRVSMGVLHRWPSSAILTAVVTYSGMSVDAIQRELEAIEDSSRPDMVLNLGRGLLIRNHGLLVEKKPATDGTGFPDYIVINSPAAGLQFFLTALTEITSTFSTRSVNWRSYF